ncbi:hypothetical protein BH09PAT3_BH09PAT3_2810 [soil metagenome]
MVEVLVAISATTLMILVITNYMMRTLQTSTLETIKGNIQREIQLTLDFVAADIRISANADQNNRNPDANSPGGTGNQYGWTSSASTLVLATAATTTNGTIIFTDAANYITTKNNIVYFVSGGTLYKRILAASVAGNGAKTTCPASKITASCPGDKELLHNVTSFTVTYLDGSNNSVIPTDARSVELSLTATKTQYKKSQSASYTTRMVFRND